jgi:hypothetical protein
MYVPDGIDPHAFGDSRESPLSPQVNCHASTS